MNFVIIGPGYISRRYEDLFTLLIADFIKAVESDRKPFITGESAKAATELIFEIYRKAGPVIS
jgi:hypothetical protein